MISPKIARVRSAESYSGFTLVELLAVVAIMLLIASFLTPALSTIFRGKEITRAANDISAIMDAARTEAMSKNTYVWLGFKSTTYNNTITSGSSVTSGTLQVVAVRSIDGTPNLISGSGTLINSTQNPPPVINYKAFTNVLSYSNIELDDFDRTPDQGPNGPHTVKNLLKDVGVLTGADVIAVAGISTSAGTVGKSGLPVNYGSGGTLGFTIPPSMGTPPSTYLVFQKIILFTPQGDAVTWDTVNMQPPTPGTKQLISSQQFAVSNEKIYVGCSRTIDGHQITTNPDVFAIVLFGGTGQNRIFRLQ